MDVETRTPPLPRPGDNLLAPPSELEKLGLQPHEAQAIEDARDQAKAAINAAKKLLKRGLSVTPENMDELANELWQFQSNLDDIAKEYVVPGLRAQNVDARSDETEDVDWGEETSDTPSDTTAGERIPHPDEQADGGSSDPQKVMVRCSGGCGAEAYYPPGMRWTCNVCVAVGGSSAGPFADRLHT